MNPVDGIGKNHRKFFLELVQYHKTMKCIDQKDVLKPLEYVSGKVSSLTRVWSYFFENPKNRILLKVNKVQRGCFKVFLDQPIACFISFHLMYGSYFTG